MTDENRIKEYQEQNPEEYGDVSVMNGVQMESTEQIKKGFVEFQKDKQPQKNAVYFRFMTAGSGSNQWEFNKVKPKIQNQKLMFELSVDDHIANDSKKQVHQYLTLTSL